VLPLTMAAFPTAARSDFPIRPANAEFLGVLVVELAVARLHVPPGPCEPRCYGRIAVVPVSLADSVPGLMRPGRLNPHGDGCRG
jgi:hypothetical protein